MKTEMIAAMENVLSRLGAIAGVEPGGVQGLIEWAEDNAALRARLSQAERLAEALENPTEEMLKAMLEKHWEIRGCQLCSEDYRDILMAALTAWEAGKEQSNG